MTGKTTAHSHRLLRSYLILGAFALLGACEIIFVVVGVQRLDDPKSWIAFAGAIFFVGVFFVVLAGQVVSLLIINRRGSVYQRRRLGDSLFEINLDGFDSRYEELLRHIDRLPDTGRKTDRDYKTRLLEIVIALKEIKNKLTQMSGTYPYKEDLQELERELLQQSSELLGIHSTFDTLWTRLRTRGTGFYQGFRKTFDETSELEMLLIKNLEYAKKEKKP